MEAKWICISIAIIFSVLGIGIGVSEYQKGQCKVAYSQTTKTAEEIKTICAK